MRVSESIYSLVRAIKGKTGQKEAFSVVVDAGTHGRLKAWAKAEGLKMGYVAAQAIRAWLDEREKRG